MQRIISEIWQQWWPTLNLFYHCLMAILNHQWWIPWSSGDHRLNSGLTMSDMLFILQWHDYCLMLWYCHGLPWSTHRSFPRTVSRMDLRICIPSSKPKCIDLNRSNDGPSIMRQLDIENVSFRYDAVKQWPHWVNRFAINSSIWFHVPRSNQRRDLVIQQCSRLWSEWFEQQGWFIFQSGSFKMSRQFRLGWIKNH